MKRRALLGLCSTMLAGCSSDVDTNVSRSGGKNYTAPSDVHVYNESKPMPEPPATLAAESAREYVATYERHRIYNELIGRDVSEPNGGHVSVSQNQDAIDLEIEPLEIELLREADHGYYFITSISGTAEYWCSYDPPLNDTRSCGSHSTRHHRAVVHFVTSSTHRRIPYNWYTCTGPDEPYGSPDDSENAAIEDTDSAAQLQLYDVTDSEHEIDVTIRFTDQSTTTTVYSATIDTPPRLTVIADITKRRGSYEIEVALDNGTEETFDWHLADAGSPSWTGTSLFIAPGDDMWSTTIDPDADIEISNTSCPDYPTQQSRTPDQ